MKTKIFLLAAGTLALLCASCKKNNAEEPSGEILGGEGNVLLETTVKNADGVTGQSYVQQIPSLGGAINMTEGIQVGFSSTLSFTGNDVFVFPAFGSDSQQCISNCKYLGGGKVAAYVGIIELMGDNPYTARNAMAVIIDLDKRTIRRIDGVPCSDGHSVAIEVHDGEVLFSSFGVDKAGVFAYNPATGAVRQALDLNGNITYIHFFE